MQEDIFPEIPKNKLFTDESIRIATFIGGPLIAGYLIAGNYKQLGELKKVKWTWLCTIIATILIFIIAFFLPSKSSAPLFPIVYSGGTFYLVRHLQGAGIKAHVAAGGKTWSVWHAVLISLAGLVITIGILFGGFTLMDQYFARN